MSDIIYLSNKQINKQKWDEQLLKCGNALVYAQSKYLDIVSPNWGALVNTDYSILVPLPIRKKFGILSYTYTPYTIQQLGVFGKCSPDELAEIVKYIKSNFILIDLKFNYENSWMLLKRHHEILRRNSNFILSLDDNYFNLNQNFSKNTQRNIKKAEQENFEVHVSKDTSVLETLIKLFKRNKAKELKMVKPKFYENMFNVAKWLLDENKAELFYIQNDKNEVIAGFLMVYYTNRATFLFSATSTEGKERNAMVFLIDNFIHQNATKNLILDFEGSNNHNLSRFYRSFGAKEEKYYAFRWQKLPFLLRK
jgi:hypothetical protein